MPTIELFRAGLITLLVGLLLFWCVPVWLPVAEVFPQNYDQLTFFCSWLFISIAGTGVLLLLRAALCAVSLRSQWNLPLRIFPDVALRNVLPWHRHPPSLLFTQLPGLGLLLSPLFSILMFFYSIYLQPTTSHGLPIHLSATDSVPLKNSPWQDTLSVYLAVGEKYYLNGKPVAREELGPKLREELSHRVVWTVYFEADYNTLNMDAIDAMDTIQGLGANILWITPQVRKNLQLASPTPPPRLHRNP